MVSRVLVVEDEEDLLAPLAYNLQQEGYEVRTATNGADGLKQAQTAPHPDVVLLDLMLPDLPGTEVCRQMKQDPSTRGIPIIMVTARGEEVDRVVGFEVGADDYVVKPYSIRELLLRVRAMLRRSQAAAAAAAAAVAASGDGDAAPGEKQTEFGLVRIDPSAHRAWVGDAEIVLTALEFRLLTTFVSRKGRVQSRDRLLDDVWGQDAVVTTRTVDTHVKRLREKLGPAGRYVETIRGVGYRWKAAPDAAAESA